jgi:hypothetical protein
MQPLSNTSYNYYQILQVNYPIKRNFQTKLLKSYLFCFYFMASNHFILTPIIFDNQNGFELGRDL